MTMHNNTNSELETTHEPSEAPSRAWSKPELILLNGEIIEGKFLQTNAETPGGYVGPS